MQIWIMKESIKQNTFKAVLSINAQEYHEEGCVTAHLLTEQGLNRNWDP